ncbi:MAG: TonB-dependent receptor, partial [Bacteroidetes bacterium]|nr:TonB-dependent receptor [Bacteroidota bacterium]
QPGSVQDVQRVVQNLPGVASSNDNMNELIVRGGSPSENLTVLEFMEVPSINHYPNQFNSAGPINMINIDLVEDVQFSAGGFPAQYGNKMSSVMDLSIREGDREKGFASNTGFNMAGIGTLMEGKIDGGRGSWIFSARQSLLEFVDKLVGMSAISLTAVPKYWDAQTKIVYDISPNHKLSLNGLVGDSKIYIEGDPENEKDYMAGRTHSSSIEFVDVHSTQYVLGLNLKSLWGKDGYSVVSLYTNGLRDRTDVREDFVEHTYGSKGEVVNYRTLSSRDIFNDHSDMALYALKYDVFYKIHPKHELMMGGQIQTTSHWNSLTKFGSDTARYDTNRDGTWDKTVITYPGNIGIDLEFADASRAFAYISDKYRISPELFVSLGLRYDYFSYSGHGQISPRGCIAYEILPTTTISFALGQYWQEQPLPYYVDYRNIGYNKKISNTEADHYVLGLQHIMDDGIKLSVEAYYKKFKNIGLEESFIYSYIDSTFWSDRILAVGKRTSYGLEFLLQKKQVTSYYGTISVSLSKTTDEDPRLGKEGNTYPSQYDYPVIINLVGGKIVKGVRSWLDDQFFLIKYLTHILPFSDEMEISFKYRYQTGGPYTPRERSSFRQYREGGVQWSQFSWISSRNINSARYPDYKRLDIEWISRFYMQNWNINVYIALMNVCDSKNVFFYNYRSDGTIGVTYQFGFFPVGGIEIEF